VNSVFFIVAHEAVGHFFS